MHVSHIIPTDDRQWLWIKELVDTQWEILRYLRYRTTTIERRQRIRMDRWRKQADQIVEIRKNQLSQLYLPLGNSGHEQVVSLRDHIPKLEATIEEVAQRKPDDAEHSGDLEEAMRFVERLDKGLKNATARRNTLLKILEFYCRPIDREAEIAAAHHDEIKQNELQQIAAPPVALAASVPDVTTEHPPEVNQPVTG
jgi:hypothetical protein